MTTPARPSWCVRCRQPAPLGSCGQCGCPETTEIRPDADWGDPTETRRHGAPMRLLEDMLIAPAGGDPLCPAS